MGRTTVLAVGVTVLGAAALVALAAPARRGLGRTVSGVTAEARRRLAAFRTDMAVRESELRAGLLPSEPDVTAARARRAGSAASAPSPDSAAPLAWRTTGASAPAAAAASTARTDVAAASPTAALPTTRP